MLLMSSLPSPLPASIYYTITSIQRGVGGLGSSGCSWGDACLFLIEDATAMCPYPQYITRTTFFQSIA